MLGLGIAAPVVAAASALGVVVDAVVEPTVCVQGVVAYVGVQVARQLLLPPQEIVAPMVPTDRGQALLACMRADVVIEHNAVVVLHVIIVPCEGGACIEEDQKGGNSSCYLSHFNGC